MERMAEFLAALASRPVIASARDISQVERAAKAGSAAVFLLGGSILTLGELTRAARAGGARVFIHLDLLGGLGRDVSAVEWCARQLKIDGVISTRAPLLKRAGELGLITVQRLFVMDSASVTHGLNLLRTYSPDMLEVLPGLMPKVIAMLRNEARVPVIAGGMITEPGEVEAALKAGAAAISTSDEKLWNWQARA